MSNSQKPIPVNRHSQVQHLTVPQDKRNSPRWAKRHQAILSRNKDSLNPPDVILIGDSIVQQWEQAGSSVLRDWQQKLVIQNLGFAGDKIQHLLWRVEHGQLDNINPALLVLNIGTNNVPDNTPQEIALGVNHLVRTIQLKLPDTQILLYRLFPRGEKHSIERQLSTQASALYSTLDKNSFIHDLDIHDNVVDNQDDISVEIMHDKLHLTRKGYEIWLKQLQPYFEHVFKHKDK
ncbi:GDSL-type esterase/lipase family protein [Shewanella surugensis]|uniref:GDSL-type esterase/lipase family protein n=1 Tax=Shewanella surugensis TaxID=212020 RepID=A0ABT0LII9_9GAMM|nr:GDSL-type esterase/lipase family protein [Shewanella surugensis]MCL1127475.1 GDSL-type esterase/lipase family protein [Shewanella surugensis]